MNSENKQLVARYYNEVLNQSKYELIDEIFDEDFKSHLSNGININLDTYKKAVSESFASLKNIEVTIEDQIAEADKVATRWTARGVLVKPFAGIRETGKKIEVSAIHIHRVENGKIKDHWEAINLHTITINR